MAAAADANAGTTDARSVNAAPPMRAV